MHRLNQRVLLGTYMTLNSLLNALVLALILGWSLATFAKLSLIFSMSFLAIPLLFTDVFTFPDWTVYVFVLWWVGQAILIRRFAPD